MKKRMILGRIENTGVRETGKLIRPDGVNWMPETEHCPEPKTINWTDNPELFPAGVQWAEENGWQVYIVDDTDDCLEQVRRKLME